MDQAVNISCDLLNTFYCKSIVIHLLKSDRSPTQNKYVIHYSQRTGTITKSINVEKLRYNKLNT